MRVVRRRAERLRERERAFRRVRHRATAQSAVAPPRRGAAGDGRATVRILFSFFFRLRPAFVRSSSGRVGSFSSVPPSSEDAGTTTTAAAALRAGISFFLLPAVVQPAAGADPAPTGSPAPGPLDVRVPVTRSDLRDLVEVTTRVDDGASGDGPVLHPPLEHRASFLLFPSPQPSEPEIATLEAFVAEAEVQRHLRIVRVGDQPTARLRHRRFAAPPGVGREEALPPVEVASPEVRLSVEVGGDRTEHQVKDEVREPPHPEVVEIRPGDHRSLVIVAVVVVLEGRDGRRVPRELPAEPLREEREGVHPGDLLVQPVGEPADVQEIDRIRRRRCRFLGEPPSPLFREQTADLTTTLRDVAHAAGSEDRGGRPRIEDPTAEVLPGLRGGREGLPIRVLPVEGFEAIPRRPPGGLGGALLLPDLPQYPLQLPL
mmetsp:Transcript_19411/g.45160  ORF Transcript_19411/g.45160 Transcript_19411/m.45160 type:complete len:430 (+) Transcript_19411:172-1461(+)